MKKVTKIDKIQPSQTSKKKLRVAAYCRVSTDSDAQLESLDTQKEHYKNYITSRDDWAFAGLYFDEGITGTKADKRPMLLQLIEDCKAKKIDFVITKSISRLSRNTTDCLEIVRTLLSLDIPIYFEKENINTGSMESELFLSILSSMAEGESASISENNKWSIKKRFLDGTYKLGYVPYGYRWKDGEILVDPAQAKIVKRIFRELLSGKGTEAIAKELNQEQVPPRKAAAGPLPAFATLSGMKNTLATAFSRRPIPTTISIATRMTVTSISTMYQITTKQLSVMRILKPQQP